MAACVVAWVRPAIAVGLLLSVVFVGCLQGGEPTEREASSVPADIVIQNATLWSPDRAPGFASALAVNGSQIVAVGDNVDRLVQEATRIIDVGGAFVAPGFQDAHMHSPVFDGNVARTIEGAAFQRPLQPSYTPTPEEQAAAQDEAVFAFQVAQHGHRRAIYEATGTDGETQRDICVPADPDEVERMVEEYKQVEAEMAAQGITTVIDALTMSLSHYEALRQLEEQGESKVRWLLRVVPGCYEHMDAMGVSADTPSDWVRIYGVKLYGDGFLGSWIAALDEPYSDRPGWNGILVYPDPVLDSFIAEAASRDLNVGTHAIGDATIAQVLDAYERAGIQPKDRWTVEHAQVIDPDIIERFAELGAVASIQLSFSTRDQRMAGDRLGDRITDAYDWRGFVDAGVVLAGGSDYPIEVITPLWGIQREVTRQEVDGSPPDGWYRDNALNLTQTLDSVTHGVAYAAGEDQERGALEAGYAADLVVLRENLFEISLDEIAGATVLMTMVNGKITFEGERSYPPSA